MADPNTDTEQGAQRGTADLNQSPQLKSRRRLLPKVGPGNEPDAALDPEDALEENEAVVNMIFPRELTLTADDHKRIKFPAGIVEVPEHLADHWYLAAHGVKRARTQRAVVEKDD